MPVRWLSTIGCALAACSAPAAQLPLDTGVTIHPRRASPPVAPDRARANRILATYGAEHALGVDRRAPTAEELAAAVDADPVDPSITPELWRDMDPPIRLLRAYAVRQDTAWRAVCFAGVESWWHAAKQIDDELATRLAQQVVPAEFHAAMATWNQHSDWLRQRQQGDAAARSLPPLEHVGASFRLVVAQNAWASMWLDHDRPLEHMLAEVAIPANAWALEAVPIEQARFCDAAFASSAHRWPPGSVKVLKPGVPAKSLRPSQEDGKVVRVDHAGTEWRVTRRDFTTTIESVPPCKRVRCTQIDCNMDDRGGWRDVCVEKKIRRHKDVAFVLHFDAAPVIPKLGDHVSFFVDATTGHAILTAASTAKDRPPYYWLRL